MGSLVSCAISAELVRQELSQIISSRAFHGAEAHKRFLQYVVEQTLCGYSNEIKEHTLGVDVFHRGSSFDARIDSIVRVEARKLRNRLARYYETEGTNDRVRIALPARGYVPVFQEVDPLTSAAEPTTSVTGGRSAEETQSPSWSAISSAGVKRWLRPVFATNISQKASVSAGLLILAIVGLLAIRAIRQNQATAEAGPSIVVLPFQNLGDIKDQSFSDGLTDELINSLGRVQGLQVVGITSAFQFRSRPADVREIGKKLNVRTVLEGGIRTYGNRLRITAELVDTQNGYSIWSGGYERQFEDALFIQQDISQAIVSALEEKLAGLGGPKELKFAPAMARAVNVGAYQDYLRGLYFWNKQTPESIETAKSYLEQAIAEDPSRAPAYTGLARCYINLPLYTKRRARDFSPKIKQLALKALELDSNSPEAHIDLAYASFVGHDWTSAEAQFKRGLELGPGDAVAHRLHSDYLVNAGRLAEALAESKISLQLDPVSPVMSSGTARVLYLMRRYDEAIEQFQKTLALDPQFIYAHLGLGTVYIQQKKYLEAIKELQLAGQLSGNNLSSLSELARAYPPLGRSQEARNILNGLLKEAANGSFPPKPIAKIYVALGENNQALAWLETAIRAQDISLQLESDPIWDPLRSDPRFEHLMRDERQSASE